MWEKADNNSKDEVNYPADLESTGKLPMGLPFRNS
jgi:hypothetical protein